MKIIKPSIVLLLFVSVTIMMTSLSFAEQDRREEAISFNFVDVEIPAVIKFISEITGSNFLFDDRIKGKITIIAPTKLTVDESFSLFTSVLGLKGYTIIPSGLKTYKIIPSSLAKQAGMIQEDETTPVNEGYITKLIPVEHIKVDEAVQFLRPVVSRDGFLSSFAPRSMLLIVDSALNIEKIVSILKLIDKPTVREEESKISVYFLENADSTDMAKVLQGIIKDLQTSRKSARRGSKKPADRAVPILSVTPDKATNSLVILASPSDYENIQRVIRKLDKKRKQVFVEAMIVEASIDKLHDLGTKWRATARNNGDPIAIGGFGNVSSGTVLDIITGLTGFSVGGMGNFLDIPVTSIGSDGSISSQTLTAPGFAALFSLDEFKHTVNVLSTPQILTSDNEEAEILVGENVPFISKREQSSTTASTVLNSIQRTDVGIKLKITPQITEGDYVKLDIFQEISAVQETSADILTTVGPTTTKRATKTSVVVKDGRTVVIGGLMQEEERERVYKMPILGDIPILGWLFKYKSVTKNKTNLLVFLSPHIIKEPPELAEITMRKQREFVEKEKYYYPGEILMKFREDIPKERVMEILSGKGASVIKYFKDINVYHIRLDPEQAVEDAVKEFEALPEVIYAEPNYRFTIKDDKPGISLNTETRGPGTPVEIDKAPKPGAGER